MKNREILFRGISVNDREFVYGAYYKGRENTYILFQKAPCEKDNQGLHPFKPCEIIPETVGQFTGLLDKNGTKIFEGDRIRYNYGFDVEESKVTTVEFGNITSDWETCSGLVFNKHHYSDVITEVIGTIHDHLLEANNG